MPFLFVQDISNFILKDKVATECDFNILRPINVHLVHNKTKSCNELSRGYECNVKTDKEQYNIFVLYALSVRRCYVGFFSTSLVNKSIITRVTLSGVLLNEIMINIDSETEQQFDSKVKNN